MRNYTKIFRITLVSAVLFSLLVMFQSCMETTVPDDTSLGELSVRAYLLVNIDGEIERLPLRGADITVSDQNQAGVAEIGNKQTDANGLAQFGLVTAVTGTNIDIFSEYNGQIQSKSDILFCNDTTVVFLFESEVIPPLDCGALGGESDLIFFDDNGSPLLRKNSPPEVERYYRCRTLFNPLGSGNTITISVPEVNEPFRLESISINDVETDQRQDLVIPQGTSITICYSVGTSEAGTYEESTDLFLECDDGSNGNFTFNLMADIIEPGCDCEYIEGDLQIVLSDRVPTGQQYRERVTVFTNELECDVTVSVLEGPDSPEWSIVSPGFPVTIADGNDFDVEFQFQPGQVGESTTIITFQIETESGNICEYELELEGESCSNACPSFGEDAFTMRTFDGSFATDTLSDRSDERVFVSVTDIDPAIITEVAESYYVENPDSACGDVEITINIQPLDPYAGNFFSVSPRSFLLEPGERAPFEVLFESPSVQQIEQIVAARGNNGTAEDSTFRVRVTLSSPGCVQNLDVTAIVTSIPDISPIINLRAYYQKTIRKATPEYEVYYFGADARTINLTQEYPPQIGDLYVDVANNDPTDPPVFQEPILVLADQSIDMKFYQVMDEDDFANVLQTVEAFAFSNYDNGYSSTPISPLNATEVYAFQFSQNLYALIYIRRVDTGEAETSNLQSGIEFRAIYPIIIR